MNTEDCPTCNLPINILEPGEYFQFREAEQAEYDANEAEHQVIHEKKKAAFIELGYWPRGKRQRREFERQADSEFSKDKNGIRHADQYIQSWFDRSLDRAAELGYWQDHPQDSTEYGRYLDLHAIFDPDVADHLRATLGNSPGPLIGLSLYWEPPEAGEAP